MNSTQAPEAGAPFASVTDPVTVAEVGMGAGLVVGGIVVGVLVGIGIGIESIYTDDPSQMDTIPR